MEEYQADGYRSDVFHKEGVGIEEMECDGSFVGKFRFQYLFIYPFAYKYTDKHTAEG